MPTSVGHTMSASVLCKGEVEETGNMSALDALGITPRSSARRTACSDRTWVRALWVLWSRTLVMQCHACLGLVQAKEELELHSSKRVTRMMAAGTFLGKQHRGHRMANAIPEYECICWIGICDMPSLDRKGQATESWSTLAQGSKCVYVTDVDGATWRLCDLMCV